MANQAPEKTAEYILSLVLQGSTWTPQNLEIRFSSFYEWEIIL